MAEMRTTMTDFQKSMIHYDIEYQNKEAIKKAKKSYINDLVKKGVDKATAKIMADTFMEYGIIKPM